MSPNRNLIILGLIMQGLSILPNLLFAQKQYNNWFVGTGFGIKFPGPVLDLNYNWWVRETTSSISDNNGNLLFYTNGGAIFDRSRYYTMAGAVTSKPFFSGFPSLSTQGCYIVRRMERWQVIVTQRMGLVLGILLWICLFLEMVKIPVLLMGK